jgi:hypothetical protein
MEFSMKYIALFALTSASLAYAAHPAFPSHVNIGYYATDADYYSKHKIATLTVPVTPDMMFGTFQCNLRISSDDPCAAVVSALYQRPVHSTYRRYDTLGHMITIRGLSSFEELYYLRSMPTRLPGIYVQTIGIAEKSTNR